MTATLTIPAGTYGLDPIHSSIGFGLRYNKLATFRSTFEKLDAQLLDGVLTGTAQVDSIAIDEPSFKAHLLAADFFDAENAPTLTFRSTEIRPAGDGSVEVDGELTVRGVTKPVTATGTLATGDDAHGNERAAFEVSTTIDRRDYGIVWQIQLPDGSEALDYDVTITADLQLVKAQEQA